MKKRILIFILSLIFTAASGFGVYFLVSSHQAPAEIEDTESKYKSMLLEAPSDGSTPEEHSAIDNVAYVLWTMANTEEFQSITTGTANASVATQEIYNERIVKNGKAMTTTVSTGMISTAKQRYYDNEERKVLLRDASKIEIGNMEWKTETPECVSYKTIMKRYGWLPFSATGYIICEETYLNKDEIQMSKTEDGNYLITFDLNPDGELAPFYYRREVLTNASSSMIPEFSYIHFEMTIDSEWKLLVSDISENYKVKSMGVEAVTKTNCHEVFTYENIAFDADSYSFFDSYKDMAPQDDELEDGPKAPDPVEMIVESLMTKDGSNTNLEIELSYGDFSTNATVSLNINDLNNVQVYALLEQIYVEYSDAIYISVGDVKLKATMEDLTNIIQKVVPKDESEESSAPALDVAQILSDLGSAKIEETDTTITIEPTLHLLGLEIPLHFEMDKTEDGISLSSISTSFLFNDKTISLSAKATNKGVTTMEHNEFQSISNIDFIVDTVSEIMTNKTVDFEIATTVADVEIQIRGNVDFNTSLSLDAEITAKYREKTIQAFIAYEKDVAYITLDDIHLMLTKEDAIYLLKKYASLELSVDSSLDIESLLNTIFSMDFATLIERGDLKEDSLGLTLNLSKLTDKVGRVSLDATKQEYGLGLTLEIDKVTISAKLGSLSYEKKERSGEYQNIKNLESLVDTIVSIVHQKTTDIQFSTAIEGIQISFIGTVDFNNSLFIDADVVAKVNDMPIAAHITYKEDILYASIANVKIKASKEDLKKYLAKYANISLDTTLDSTEILNTVFRLDIPKWIQSLELKDKEAIIDLNLSSLSEKLANTTLSISTQEKGIGLSLHILDMDIHASAGELGYEPRELTGDYQDIAYIEPFIDAILQFAHKKSTDIKVAFTYGNVTIDAIGTVSFADALEAYLDITLHYQSYSAIASIVYKEDTIFLEYQNLRFKITKTNLMHMLETYAGISLNKESGSIVETIFGINLEQFLSYFILEENKISLGVDPQALIPMNPLDITLEYKDESIQLEVSNDDIYVTAIIGSLSYEKKNISGNYQDLQNLDGIVSSIVDIVKTKKIAVALDAAVEDIHISGNVYVDFTNELKVKAPVTLSYKDIALNATIYYFDKYNEEEKVILVDINSSHIYLPLSAIPMNSESLDLDFLLEALVSDKFSSILKNICIEESQVSLDVNLGEIEMLQKLIQITKDLHIELKKQDGLSIILSNALDASLSISSFAEEIELASDSYTSIEPMVETILKAFQWVKKESFSISLDGTLRIKDMEIAVDGTMDFLWKENSYTIQANLHVILSGTEHNVQILYVNQMIYVTYGGLCIGLSTDDISNFIRDISELFTLPEMDLSHLNEVLKTVSISSNGVFVSLSDLTDLIHSVGITLDYDEEEEKIAATISGEELQISLAMHSIEDKDISIPEKYTTYSDISVLLENVQDAIELVKKDDLSLDIDMDVYQDGYKYLNINGTVDLNKKEKLSFEVNAAITEYKNDEEHTVKVIHRVHVLLLDGKIYIEYGNMESDPTSQIKLVTNVATLNSILGAATEFLGISLPELDLENLDLSSIELSSLTDLFKKEKTEEKAPMCISSLLHVFSLEQNQIHIELGQLMTEGFTLEDILGSVQLEENAITLQVENFYLNYAGPTSYKKLDIHEVSLASKEHSFNAPESLTGYYDISDIDELVQGVLRTVDHKEIELKGNVTLTAVSLITVQVPVTIQVKFNDDFTPEIYVLMEIPKVSALVTLLTKKNVEFFYKDGYVYIHRHDIDSDTVYDLKVTRQEFFDDILYYLLDFAIGMPDSIMSKISASTDENEDYVIDAGRVINTYEYKNHSFTVGLNMGLLTGNSNLEDLEVSLDLSLISKLMDDEIDTDYALTSISDFSFNLVKVITLSSSKLAVSNVTTNEGYTYFTSVDMSRFESFVEEYSYGTDMIYKNGAFTSKRSHTVTFINAFGKDGYYSGPAGTQIKFLSLDIYNNQDKYYHFVGWYMDKECQTPFTDSVVPEYNVRLYAKWEEITFYTLTIKDVFGDTTMGAYYGMSIESIYDKSVYNDKGKTYLFQGYSLTPGGEIIPLTTMPNEDITIYSNWIEVEYQLYIDGVFYSKLQEDVLLSLTGSYFLQADSMCLRFDGTVLLYDVLVKQYGRYAVMEDSILKIHLLTSISSEYYVVDLDYDSSKFSNMKYDAIAMPKDSTISFDLLPNGIYNHYEINYWYSESGEYHRGNIETLPKENVTLKAYYATADFLSYGWDEVNGKKFAVTGFDYEGEECIDVLLPKYVWFDGKMEVLQTLSVISESEEKSSIFTGNEKIRSIVFAIEFTTIGENAFKNCKNLRSVYFSDTITQVASNAFYFTCGKNYEANRDIANQLRFYFGQNSSITEDQIRENWLACKWNSSSRYYENIYKVIGAGDFTNAYQKYSISLEDFVHQLI